MAIAYDATADGSATSNSLTYAHTCSAGDNRLLVVGVNIYNSGGITADVTGVTYDGNAMTLITEQDSRQGHSYDYMFYILNPSSGSNNVVVSKTTSSDTIRSCSVSYTGVAQSGQADAFGSHKLAARAIAISKEVTTVVDNCWMVSFTFNDANLCIADTGTTLRNADLTYAAIGDSNGVISPAGAYTMGWTLAVSTADWEIINASFKPYVETGTNMQINKGGWKAVNSLQVNKGGWKAIPSSKINKGGYKAI